MPQKFIILVPDSIGFAPWSVLLGPGEPCDSCQQGAPPLVSSWSMVWDVECVTSFAVLHNGVCSRSECGHLSSLWRCIRQAGLLQCSRRQVGVDGALDRDRDKCAHLIFAGLVQATARVDVQVARVLAHLARQSHFSLCSTACSCDVLGGGKQQVVMWSHGACACSSQSFQASSGCRFGSRSWMCQSMEEIVEIATFEQATARVDVYMFTAVTTPLSGIRHRSRSRMLK